MIRPFAKRCGVLMKRFPFVLLLGVALMMLVGLVFPGMALAADCASGDAASTDVGGVINKLSGTNACWSCVLYGSIFDGLHSVVYSSYQALVSQSLGAVTLGSSICAVVFVMKFIPFLVGASAEMKMIADVRLFLIRMLFVFATFLTPEAYMVVGTGSDLNGSLSSTGWVTDLYIDGPLAISTSIASSVSGAVVTGFSGATGYQGKSLFENTSAWDNGGTDTFGKEHKMAAQSLLYSMHELGVMGIACGLWLVLNNNFASAGSGIVSAIAQAAAGFFMTWTFFTFTMTFGLRYIDALIRSMLIFSLIPLWAFLWIFDSTRGMAVQAVKSGLALCGVFAVSGVVFSVAFFVMFFGFMNAFQNQSVNFTGLTQILCSLNDSIFYQVMSPNNTQSSMSWMSYFFLVGSASMATACSGLAFDLAEQLFDFGGADMGAGSAVSGQFTDAIQSGISAIRGFANK